MTVMWSIYLLNAVYGFVMWSRMSKRTNNNKEEKINL
ncbi:MAG: hypothetical protein MJ142_08160 [Clostridia bacterium]|nr:hypothetical protein [Clostridia bacterium]